MRRTLAALAGLTTGVLAAAAALIPALPASAAPPFTRVHLVVDFTRPVDICAFPVIAHSEGTLTGEGVPRRQRRAGARGRRRPAQLHDRVLQPGERTVDLHHQPRRDGDLRLPPPTGRTPT